MNLEFDIKRTIVLSEYLKAWGQPEARRCLKKGNCLIELYAFKDELITRHATIGLSSCHINDTELCNSELLLCVPNYVTNSQGSDIENYIFDICAYLIEMLGRDVRHQDLIPESDLAPDGWPKAVLFDEPRGEPEELECFQVGSQHINLLWVIPIYGNEYKFIKEHGINEFDLAADVTELSLIDVKRQPFVKNS